MKKLSCLLFLLYSALSYCQKSPCGSEELWHKALTQNPELQRQIQEMDQTISRSKFTGKGVSALPPAGSITVPVVFYVIHDGTAATNLTDAQVNTQLATLNSKFSASGIKFCLATRAATGSSIPLATTSDPQTQATPGIIHYQKASLLNHLSSPSGMAALVATANPAVTAERYLRIWVVTSIDGPLPGILGYAGLPFSTFQGIVMRNNAFGTKPANLSQYNEGEVLVHEVGHFLGLYHTFEEGCTTTYGSQLLDGDKVADTPKVAEANYSCITGTNSCPEMPAAYDLIHNYMDYGNNLCADSFTTGQMERMVSMIDIYRSTLVSTDNIIYTGSCNYLNLLSATITPSSYNVCASSTVPVSFTATSASTYAWTFGDGGTSTLQNPTHLYTSAAGSPYTVTLTVTNTTTGQTAVSSTQIFVNNCAAFVPNSDSYWFTGVSHGLNFNSGIPAFDTNFPQDRAGNKTVASQCNASGQLLFYTNGVDVWNGNHTKINTVAIGSANTDTAATLIVPNPGNSNQYYILTTGASIPDIFNTSACYGFEYSIVNIVGGVATSMAAVKQPVAPPAGFATGVGGAAVGSAGFSAIKKCSNDYWILTSLVKNAQMYAVVYKISAAATGPVFNTGSDMFIKARTATNGRARIESAPNGNKVLLYGDSFSYPWVDYVYDFDKVTGLFDATSQKTINHIAGDYTSVGTSFSPDSKALYMIYAEGSSNTTKVWQYNINTPNINASRREIGKFGMNLTVLSMQLGPDNKIYLNTSQQPNENKLGIIHKPNAITSIASPNACYFSANGPIRPTAGLDPQNYVAYQLPNLIDAKTATAYPGTNTSIASYLTGCKTYKFFPDWCGTVFNWDFGDPASGAANTSTANDPTHLFSAPGTYNVKLRNFANILIASVNIVVTGPPNPVIVGNSSACTTTNSITNNAVVLTAGQTAVWSITGGAGTITGPNNQSSVNINWTSLPGTISLTITDAAGCVTSATKTIQSVCDCSCLTNLTFEVFPMEFGTALDFEWYHNSVEACDEVISAIWDFGDGTTPTGQNVHQFAVTGTYTVTLTVTMSNGCTRTLTAQVYAGGTTGGGPGTGNGRVSGAGPADDSVKITPNPSKGIFNIRIEKYTGKVNIEVHDMSGKLVFEAKGEDFNIEKAIDLSRFNTGTYLLKIEGDRLNYTRQLIKN